VTKRRKLHNEELHNFCSYPNIIKRRWETYKACTGQRRIWENQKETDHYKDLDTDWDDSIKMDLKKI
jgi:hypothetical protein